MQVATQLHCGCTIREVWPLVIDCDMLHFDEKAMSTWRLKILNIIVKRLFWRHFSKVGHPRSWIILVTLQLLAQLPVTYGAVMLDLFKLVGVPAGVVMPDSGSVLDSRPDTGFAGYVASIFGARPQVLGMESMATVARLQIESSWLLKVSSEYSEKFS